MECNHIDEIRWSVTETHLVAFGITYSVQLSSHRTVCSVAVSPKPSNLQRKEAGHEIPCLSRLHDDSRV